MSTWEPLAGLPARDRGLRARAAAGAGLERLRAQEHRDPPARRAARRASARTSPTTPSTTRSCRPPADAAARRALHARVVLRAASRSSTLFPEPPQREVSSRYRTWAYESAALDLALRQARHDAARGARPRAAAGALRRLAAPRRAADARADPPRLELYPGLRFKLDPTSSWDERADRRAGRHRRGRLGRLQGLLLRLDRRPAGRPGALPARRRGLPRTPGSRTRR